MFIVGHIRADNPGSFWGDAGGAWTDNLDDFHRYMYLKGLRDGKKEAFGEIMAIIDEAEANGLPLSSTVKGELFTSLLGDQPQDKIRDIMTKMYEDPANSYIPWCDMYRICRDQLNGIDVSQKILKIRKALMDYQRKYNNSNSTEIKGSP